MKIFREFPPPQLSFERNEQIRILFFGDGIIMQSVQGLCIVLKLGKKVKVKLECDTRRKQKRKKILTFRCV